MSDKKITKVSSSSASGSSQDNGTWKPTEDNKSKAVTFRVIAAIALLTDLINIGDANNMGGHIAHLGGALFGYLSIKQLRQGNDLTEGFSKIMDVIANWFKPKSKIKKSVITKYMMVK